MRNPLLRPLTAALLALSFTAGAQALSPEEGPLTPLSPEAEHPETALAVLEQLARHHYVRRAIDDTLSSDTLDHYLDALDPQRAYFLEGDIAQFERYRYTLDDALRRGDLTPACCGSWRAASRPSISAKRNTSPWTEARNPSSPALRRARTSGAGA